MTVDITYRTGFFKKLAPRYQRVIELNEACRQASQLQLEAEIEGTQRVFFAEVGDAQDGFGAPTRILDGHARLRVDAGRKAAVTRRKNDQLSKKITSSKPGKNGAGKISAGKISAGKISAGKKTRKTIANYNKPAGTGKGGRGPILSNDKLEELVLRTVTENPGKYNMDALRKIIPGNYDRIVGACEALQNQDKMHRQGLKRVRGGTVRQFGEWFPGGAV
jgi:hypothetical protein